MAATTLYLANGLTRIVKGRAAEIGAALKARSIGDDDRIRQFIDLDGETLTIRADAVMMTEAAEAKDADRVFGFARALEAA